MQSRNQHRTHIFNVLLYLFTSIIQTSKYVKVMVQVVNYIISDETAPYDFTSKE